MVEYTSREVGRLAAVGVRYPERLSLDDVQSVCASAWGQMRSKQPNDAEEIILSVADNDLQGEQRIGDDELSEFQAALAAQQEASTVPKVLISVRGQEIPQAMAAWLELAVLPAGAKLVGVLGRTIAYRDPQNGGLRCLDIAPRADRPLTEA